jgi:hypothetical protein
LDLEPGESALTNNIKKMRPPREGGRIFVAASTGKVCDSHVPQQLSVADVKAQRLLKGRHLFEAHDSLTR